MMASPCTQRQPAYNDRRGVENLTSGNRTRQTCGIFVLGIIASTFPINGQEGKEIPNTLRRSGAVSNLLITPNRVFALFRKSPGGHHGRYQ